MDDFPPIRIGVSGTGHIATRFLWAMERDASAVPVRVLTRRPLSTLTDFDYAPIATHEIEDLVEHSDVIVESSGDPIHATNVVAAAVAAGVPVVTMNAEFQVTSASAFVGRGIVTEAEGDQPGSIAALAYEAREMGFEPVVYGNMKGFRNLDPKPEDMRYWADRQGYSIEMTTSFTDGTKVNIEQALVANGLDAATIEPGLLGPSHDDLFQGGLELARYAEQIGRPVSDYVLSAGNSHGVFVMATHDERHAEALQNYKLGPGPYYMLMKHDLTAYLEILKTVKRVVRGQDLFLDNSVTPSVSVAAITKRAVPAGTHIASAIGSFDFRGISVNIAEHPGHAPIGLMRDVVVERALEPGEIVMLSDLHLDDSLALQSWGEIERRVLEQSPVGGRAAG